MQELKRRHVRACEGSAETSGVSDEHPQVVVHQWRREPRSVGAARRLLLRHLGAPDLKALADTAELVVSELVTNAVRHAHGPRDRLIQTRFERLPDATLRIEVHDANAARPVREEPSADAERGRGLALVDALTHGRWGVSEREGVGKCVWAVVGTGAGE